MAKRNDGGKKIVEKGRFGPTGVSSIQLFAVIALRLHFNTAFLGIQAVLA